MSKYMDTKKGSLEESILGLWEKAADEKMEATGDKEKYQKFFQSALKKFGVKSPAELKGEKKKEYYDNVDKNYVGDHEESKSVKEEVELDEQIDAMTQYAVYDMSYNSKILSVQKSIQKARDYKKDYEKMTKGDPRFKNMRLKIAALKPEYSNAKLHQVLKSFMIAKDNKGRPVNEASELGTKEDRDEKLDLTPGQSKEDFEKQMSTMQQKNNSMRKVLADIWGIDKGKSPFEEDQKKPKKEDKKTMTGKPETKVEVDPNVKETNEIELLKKQTNLKGKKLQAACPSSGGGGGSKGYGGGSSGASRGAAPTSSSGYGS